jgi:hypothetical protein
VDLRGEEDNVALNLHAKGLSSRVIAADRRLARREG